MGRILQVICGCVLAVALSGAAPQPNTQNGSEPAQPQQEPQGGPPPVPGAATQAVEKGDSSVLTAPCPEGQDYRKSDLCAQWKAADAARDAALWAMLGTLVAAIGTAGLYWQISLTREAVQDTGEATKAMREANRIQQSTIRPWIDLLPDEAEISHRELWWQDGKVVGQTIGGGDPSINATFQIKNVGKSPAYDIFWQSGRLRGQWQLIGEPDIHAPGGEAFYAQVATKGGTGISALMPGEGVTVQFVMSLDDDNMSEDRPRIAPRYAVFLTYRGDGIDGEGQTGKVFMFHRVDKEPLDPAPGDNLDGAKVFLTPVDTVRHLK